jgi:hypothetical protein
MKYKSGGIIYHKNKKGDSFLLLVLNKRSQKWGFPKGSKKRWIIDKKYIDKTQNGWTTVYNKKYVEMYETDIVCAKREIHEETGIMLYDPWFENAKKVKICGITYYYFQFEHMIHSIPMDNNEIDKTEWFNIVKLKQLGKEHKNLSLRRFLDKTTLP